MQVSYKGGSDVGVYAMAHAMNNGTNWHYVTFFANNYEAFQYLNYGIYVEGQIGYQALCWNFNCLLFAINTEL